MLSPNPALRPILSGAVIRSRIVIWVIGAMVLFLGFGAAMWVIGSENANPPGVSRARRAPRGSRIRSICFGGTGSVGRHFLSLTGFFSGAYIGW